MRLLKLFLPITLTDIVCTTIVVALLLIKLADYLAQ